MPTPIFGEGFARATFAAVCVVKQLPVRGSNQHAIHVMLGTWLGSVLASIALNKPVFPTCLTPHMGNVAVGSPMCPFECHLHGMTVHIGILVINAAYLSTTSGAIGT